MLASLAWIPVKSLTTQLESISCRKSLLVGEGFGVTQILLASPFSQIIHVWYGTSSSLVATWLETQPYYCLHSGTIRILAFIKLVCSGAQPAIRTMGLEISFVYFHSVILLHDFSISKRLLFLNQFLQEDNQYFGQHEFSVEKRLEKWPDLIHCVFQNNFFWFYDIRALPVALMCKSQNRWTKKICIIIIYFVMVLCIVSFSFVGLNKSNLPQQIKHQELRITLSATPRLSDTPTKPPSTFEFLQFLREIPQNGPRWRWVFRVVDL